MCLRSIKKFSKVVILVVPNMRFFFLEKWNFFAGTKAQLLGHPMIKNKLLYKNNSNCRAKTFKYRVNVNLGEFNTDVKDIIIEVDKPKDKKTEVMESELLVNWRCTRSYKKID